MHHRSFRYIALVGSTVLSGVVAYKVSCHNKAIIYAAGANTTTPENPGVLRSGLALHVTPEWNKNWDFREAITPRRSSAGKNSVPSLAQRFGGDQSTMSTSDVNKTSVTRHLVFIRHGQYVMSDEDNGKILTDLGRQQAGVTGQRLQLLHTEKYNIDKLVISTMLRAKETGDIIRKSLPGIPYEYCDFLIEGAPCRPEPASSKWKPEHQEIFQDSSRIEAAFRKYFHRADPEQKKDSIEVYVCHANVIRYFICRALQFPAEGWLRMSIGHCGITWLTIRPNGKVSLRSMGDTGHLSPTMITTS